MDKEDLYKHELYMKRCISLANIAKKRGDSPVGWRNVLSQAQTQGDTLLTMRSQQNLYSVKPQSKTF